MAACALSKWLKDLESISTARVAKSLAGVNLKAYASAIRFAHNTTLENDAAHSSTLVN